MTEELAEPDQHYDRVVDDLTAKFTGVHGRDTIEKAVAAARAELETEARVVTYLPVLTAKLAHDRLAATAAGDQAVETS